MDKKIMEQGQGRDPIQEETEGVEEEGSFHIQIGHGKDKTEVQRSVQTQSTI